MNDFEFVYGHAKNFECLSYSHTPRSDALFISRKFSVIDVFKHLGLFPPVASSRGTFQGRIASEVEKGIGLFWYS